MRAIRAAMVAGALAWAQFAGATSGGVDFNGCHESKKQGFHCHPERATGAAGGGAFSLVCGADIVIASSKAKLASGYTKIGLTPDGRWKFLTAGD